MKKVLFALALMLAAAFSAFAASPPGQASGFPMATQSVSVMPIQPAHVDAQATKAMQDARMQATASDTGLALITTHDDRASVAQTDCAGCRVAEHAGCGQREQHPMGHGKGKGGGKRPPKCIGAGFGST